MDVVITYVDDTEGLRKEYAQYCKKEFQENRFRSYGVLDLQVRGIRKYMPYVKNIFIVVNYKIQVKDYDFTGLNVTIVEHRKIIPKLFLPCFNSCAIEMFLHNIPGLDEEFVYFNDDCFVINDSPYEHWFKDGKPCIHPTILNINDCETNTYRKNLYNSTQLVCSIFSNGLYASGKYITQEHCPRPFLKSTIKKVWDEAGNEIKKSLTRLRNSKNYNATLFNDYDYLNNTYNEYKHNYKYINIYDDELFDYIIDKRSELICINDNDYINNFVQFCQKLRDVFIVNITGDMPLNKINEITVNESIDVPDKIIVTFTSWTKRIQYCKHIVDLMMKQTILPYKIILNLSEDEFVNKEKDLPDCLVKESKCNDRFEIYWVKENYKQFKKLVHTLNRYQDDIVISIDDDMYYPADFIECMYNAFISYNKECPITCGPYMWKNNLYSHNGSFTITMKKFYGEYLNDLIDNLVKPTFYDIKWFDDPVYTYACLLNKHRYKYINTKRFNNIKKEKQLDDPISNKNESSYKNDLLMVHNKIKEYIFIKYNKTYETLFSNDIIVNFTTWKKRDCYVYEMLKNFNNQIIKPYKIICWLSASEYDHKIPKTLQKCLDEKLLTDIKFVDGNTYAHKRWETFKFNNDKYNIMIDDDIYYPNDFIYQLIKLSYQYQDCVCCYYTKTVDYNNRKRKYSEMDSNPSYKNTFFSGLSCFPPYTFPIKSFTFANDRDKYCSKCDDTWVHSWLIKSNIKIIGYKDGAGALLKTIDGTEENGIWETFNSKSINGINQKSINMANAIKICNIENNIKLLWPQFDINICSTIK